jgi:sucrose phosphorylase
MQNKVQLIAYADRFGGTINGLAQLLRTAFAGVYEGVHLLPFFTPFDGDDAGFDPIDHTKVDRRLGTWEDVAQLSRQCEVMSDLIVNSVSDRSHQFKGVERFGERSKYYPMFLTFSHVFPQGASEEDLMHIHTQRTGLPFAVYQYAGKPRMVWQSFRGSVDIDVNSREGWKYLMSVLDAQSDAGIRSVNLVSAASAIKKAGGTDFLMPETLDFIHRLTQAAHERGLEAILDSHTYYRTKVKVATQVDWVYDFGLEPLLLYALLFGDAEPLAQWLDVRPRNCITVIDTHDGIGVQDASQSPVDPNQRGFLDQSQVSSLIAAIGHNTHGESIEASGASANNVDYYQVNSTFYSALGCDDQKYLAARAVQFFLPGIPQVYYMGAMMGNNDVHLFRQTRVGRNLNRHYYSEGEVRRNLMRPEVKALNALCRFRNQLDAFDGEFTAGFDDVYGVMSLQWTGKTSQARLDFDAAVIADRQQAGKDAGIDPDIAWRSIATITWTDATGEHKTNNLVSNPPVAHVSAQ